MASCKININFTSSAEQLANQARTAIIGAKGQFSGDANSGNFGISTPVGGIKGEYTISGNRIAIVITDKPFLLSCSRIESELRGYLQSSIG